MRRNLLWGYKPQAGTADGSNDYLTRGADLTGIADGKVGTASVWLQLVDTAGGAASIAFGLAGDRFLVLRESNNRIRVAAQSSAGANVLDLQYSPTVTAPSIWLNVLASWDLAAPARHLYVNDVSNLSTNTSSDVAIDYTAGNAAVGATTSGSAKWNGNLAEIWFDPTTYIDLSVEDNRRKFITEAGKPADLGPDGSRPTGSKPIIYLRHPASQFGTNSGTGGNFTINGALTAATTRP